MCIWCPVTESNGYRRSERILSPPCLPISPTGLTWSPEQESNLSTWICNPLPNQSATGTFGAGYGTRNRVGSLEGYCLTSRLNPRISAGYIHPAARWIGDLRTQVSMILHESISASEVDAIGLGHHSYFTDRLLPIHTPTVHETFNLNIVCSGGQW